MGSTTVVPATTAVLVAGSADWTASLAEGLESAIEASVRIVPTIAAAVEATAARRFDCIVTGYELGDGTGLDLLRTVEREEHATPVVVCTAVGSEQVASEAIGAGATDYVAIPESRGLPLDELVDRVSRAICDARRARRRRDGARAFDAVLESARTATWVVDPSGTVVRANETARRVHGDGVSSNEPPDGEENAATGRPFWELPGWAETPRIRADVEAFVTDVVERRATGRIVTTVGAADERTIDLSAVPVDDPDGSLVGVVIEGDDVTERVSLYRELRESEELHRVTLNNMTDTVLVTDGDGAFTYVCPNVHFIFGYTVEEIRELGTIDRLLGADLFDRDALAAEGVLTNVECTTTDKSGVEHVLLVNVREVDIQGGTLLFSCRDVTKRKRREEALVTLQGTTRNLLYAESATAVAQLLVEDSADVLDLPANAIYLFDTEENVLRPAAYTEAFAELHGPLSAVEAGSDTLVGSCLLENEPIVVDDVRRAEWAEHVATELRSVTAIPLDDHGVLVAGSPDPGQFHSIRREIADLLAATAEAALDRVERERQLRAQDRTLQRQNAQLTQLNDVNELIRDIGHALVRAESRDEVDRAVCEALTRSTHFSFAWIGERDPDEDGVAPTAWAGDEAGYLDAVEWSFDPPGGDPACHTAVTREPTVVHNVAEELRQDDWQKEALARGYLSIVSVPLVYDGFTYGVLTVYADSPRVFDDVTQAVLAELGETVAAAISALNRKNALLTSTSTRITLETTDPRFELLQLARRADCSVTFEGGVQQTAEGSAIFVTVSGGAIDEVVSTAEALVGIDGVRVLSDDGTDGVVQLELTRPFVARQLADHGAVLRRVEADRTTAELVVDVPTNVDSRPVVQHVRDTLADTALVAKYTEDETPTRDLYATFLERVTERQLEVVQTAYYSGYFESPREQTGEEVAAALGISAAAFYKHARAVQRKLFSALFDDVGVPAIESV